MALTDSMSEIERALEGIGTARKKKVADSYTTARQRLTSANAATGRLRSGLGALSESNLERGRILGEAEVDSGIGSALAEAFKQDKASADEFSRSQETAKAQRAHEIDLQSRGAGFATEQAKYLADAQERIAREAGERMEPGLLDKVLQGISGIGGPLAGIFGTYLANKGTNKLVDALTGKVAPGVQAADAARTTLTNSAPSLANFLAAQAGQQGINGIAPTVASSAGRGLNLYNPGTTPTTLTASRLGTQGADRLASAGTADAGRTAGSFPAGKVAIPAIAAALAAATGTTPADRTGRGLSYGALAAMPTPIGAPMALISALGEMGDPLTQNQDVVNRMMLSELAINDEFDRLTSGKKDTDVIRSSDVNIDRILENFRGTDIEEDMRREITNYLNGMMGTSRPGVLPQITVGDYRRLRAAQDKARFQSGARVGYPS